MLQFPCGQRDRLQGKQHETNTSYASSFYRCQTANEVLRYTQSVRTKPSDQRQWTEAGDGTDSSTPSLGHTSSPSLEDESSPKTPSSLSGGALSQSYCSNESKLKSEHTVAQAFGQQKRSFDVDIQSHPDEGSYINQDLPSRPKSYSTPARQSSQELQPKSGVQPVIYETAVRSRLARHKPLHEQLNRQSEDCKPVVTFNSRCHARRKPCGEARACAPPKLKRDTDCTDAIVRLLVCFSTRLVHAIWSPSHSSKPTSFQGPGVLPLEVFIQETLRRSKTSYSTLQVALFYLILLRPHISPPSVTQSNNASTCRALQCGRRMFLTALILASKYLQDRNYSSRAWSKISGLPINEINENERRYLGLIQFNLHIEKSTFENWSKVVLTLCKVGEVGSDKVFPVASDHTVGTDGWWSYHLRRLTVDVVKKTESMEEYLASLTGLQHVAEVYTDPFSNHIDSPPSSPDSVGEIARESGATKASLSHILSIPSTDSFSDATASPISTRSLPSRPYPANLPTPQSTPGYGNSLSYPQSSCAPMPRCKASFQVLGGLDRQASSIANLETCPPPKPRLCDSIKKLSCPFRRQASGLSSALTTSSVSCSPESTVSDVSTNSMRSRSSSISSNSSVWWPSGNRTNGRETCEQVALAYKASGISIAPNRPLPANQASGTYGFYHPMKPMEMKETLGRDNTCLDRNTVFSRFQDEGYGSDESAERPLLQMQQASSGITEYGSHVPTVAAKTRPAAASFSATEQSPPRLHKRERSTTADSQMQELVRNFLQPDTASYFSDSASKQSLEKQIQCPSKDWACSKRPVPNISHTKRIALQHPDPQDHVTCAPDLASIYLRDEDLMLAI